MAFVLGGIGAHKFYMGRPGIGVLYMFFFWTLIPAAVSLVEGFIYLAEGEEAWLARFDIARVGETPSRPHQMEPSPRTPMTRKAGMVIGGLLVLLAALVASASLRGRGQHPTTVPDATLARDLRSAARPTR